MENFQILENIIVQTNDIEEEVGSIKFGPCFLSPS
jgi:hypothetical protein